MDKQLKILHIEDSPADAGLIERQLVKAGFKFIVKIVETKEDFVHSLEHFKPDLILSDHSLPQFDSMEALGVFNKLKCEIPFILITGSVSEEFAIRSIKEGADDYILKNNLIRLPSAIRQALKARLIESEKRKANMELAETNRELNTFIYKAAHDLRGPLCSIMGLTNIATLEEEKENLPDYIRKISESTQKLDAVLLSLIDLMSIKDSPLDFKEINFKTIVDNVLSKLKTAEGYERIKFEIILHEVPGFFSDEKIVNSILYNTIDNAIKYRNDTNPKIRLEVLAVGDEIKMEISDNGIGIEQNLLDRIFDMYFRGSQRAKGSGLGLYIVQKGVKKMGGAIEARSEFLKGSVFTITLPYQSIRMQ